MQFFKEWKERYKSLNPRLNLPTKLTLFRIGLSPIFFIVLFLEHHAITRPLALLLFLIAALSDAYDGYLARKDGQVTKFGKIIDPIADKFLISVALIGFYLLNYTPLWVVIIILLREYFITLFRIIGVWRGIVIGADRWGKYKTTAQMTYIITVLVYLSAVPLFPNLPAIFHIVAARLLAGLLICTLTLTVYSGVNYLVKNWTLFRQITHG